MATPDSNIHDPNLLGGPADATHERDQARKLAERYRCGFIDLAEQRIDPELFRTIPADLMFRYSFVPLVAHNNTLVIAVADPGLVILSDELPLLLGKKLTYKVATARQISDLLKRTEQSQRVLEQATEAFTLQVSKEDEDGEETISADRLTRDTTVSPVVRLVETIIFTALERRASDIHIEARDTEVAVKYRIDGVLQHAMQPIAKEWHSTVLSRIKVLSDLDIAERRVPQDGRFRVKYKGRYIDLRVSIMPANHGEDAVLRVLDKESMSEKFAKLSLDVVGFSDADLGVFKTFALKERMNLGIGLMAFNAFNHLNPPFPNNTFANTTNSAGATIPDPTFGKITGGPGVGSPTSPYGNFLGFDSSPRVVQLSAKITF